MTSNRFATIHIAKKQLGMVEDDYRGLLQRVTGKDSLRAMNDAELSAVVCEMKALGFTYRIGGLRKAGKAYQRQIHALWRSCAERDVVQDGSRKALRAFVKNMTGIDDPDLLDYAQASPVIEALKKMEARG